MSIRTRRSAWQAQLVCTAVYAMAYLLLREVTISQWNMLTTLRLASLLLLPYRYWGALLLGEALPLILENCRALEQLGGLWFCFASLPPILLLMPLVFSLQHLLPRTGRHTGEYLPGLLWLALAAAMVITLRGLLQYSIGPLGSADDQALRWSVLAGRYMVGNFVPAITILPLALMANEYLTGGRRPLPWWRMRLAMPLRAELLLALLLIVGITGWGHGVRHGLRLGFQLSLLLPVLWLALRHGWRPAALASAAVSISMTLVMPIQHDPYSLEVEIMYAFIMTTILLLGARTSVLRQAVNAGEGSARLARQNLYSHELKLRQSARTLNGLHQELQLTHTRLLHRLHLLGPAQDEQQLRRELGDLGHLLERLSRSLAFSPWYAAYDRSDTDQGSVAHILKTFGISYHADPCGQLSLLPADVMTVLSRLTCEIVAQLILSDPRQHISIRSSTQFLAGADINVQLTVESMGTSLLAPMRGALLADLGANGLNFEEIQAMAGLFHGDFWITPTDAGGTQASLTLCAPSTQRRHLSKLALWRGNNTAAVQPH